MADTNDIAKVPFYMIERVIKTYRQFAQRRLLAAGSSLTVDQWLILNVIEAMPGMQQQALAEKVFKDKASVARTVDLLVDAEMITRTVPSEDRRSVSLKLTRQGAKQLAALAPVVNEYRKQALKGISKAEIKAMLQTMDKIISNCHE
jgi:DNA-binding MarR family transcriptional regulator